MLIRLFQSGFVFFFSLFRHFQTLFGCLLVSNSSPYIALVTSGFPFRSVSSSLTSFTSLISKYDATTKTSHTHLQRFSTSLVNHMSSQCSHGAPIPWFPPVIRTGWFVCRFGNTSDNSDFPWYAYDIRKKSRRKGISALWMVACTPLSLMLCDSSETPLCFIPLYNCC